MTADRGLGEGSVGDRGVVEQAVTLLLAAAPAGWTQLHATVEPSAQPVVATATALTPGGAVPVPVPPGVVDVLAEHQRRAAAAGAPWQRMVIECATDGRLSVWTEPAAAVGLCRPHRWPQWLLAAVTVVCLSAAGVVFATQWRWGPPPRVGMIEVPPPPPRQQEAFEVIQRWLDAERDADVAKLRALACANPSESVLTWIDTLDVEGQIQALAFPDAVIGFRDEGSRVWIKVAVRVRPLDDFQRVAVEDAQHHGGFLTDAFTLADEGGQLKVCDMSRPVHE